MDLDAAAEELYGMDPAEFTSHRDSRAAEARRAGDRDLAATLKALKRPTAAAWVVNVLARQRPDEVEQLVELGSRLRAAQAALSAEQLRALGRQRQQVVAALGREAARLARDLGHPVSQSVMREVEDTLEAAIADDGAGAAVRGGRLTRSLRHSGLGTVDLEGATATQPGAAPEPLPEEGPSQARPGKAAEAAAREVAAARRAADEAEAELGVARTEAAAAARQAAECRAAVDQLSAELAAARDRAASSETRADEARRAVDVAVRRLESARDRLAASLVRQDATRR